MSIALTLRCTDGTESTSLCDIGSADPETWLMHWIHERAQALLLLEVDQVTLRCKNVRIICAIVEGDNNEEDEGYGDDEFDEDWKLTGANDNQRHSPH